MLIRNGIQYDDFYLFKVFAVVVIFNLKNNNKTGLMLSCVWLLGRNDLRRETVIFFFFNVCGANCLGKLAT